MMSQRLHAVPAGVPMEAPTGTELVFESFFEENRRRLFGAFCLITGSRDEAEDIVQDAFLKVWERWEQVSTMEDPAGFLFTTAMNVFRNRIRRAGVAVRKTLTRTPEPDALAAVEDRDAIVRALHPLTSRQRAALILTGYLGYSSVEAAKTLGIRASTVRALTTKARLTLREPSQERS